MNKNASATSLALAHPIYRRDRARERSSAGTVPRVQRGGAYFFCDLPSNTRAQCKKENTTHNHNHNNQRNNNTIIIWTPGSVFIYKIWPCMDNIFYTSEIQSKKKEMKNKYTSENVMCRVTRELL